MIKEIKLALLSGVGTKAWAETPTLQDFYKYCSPAFIKLDSIASNSRDIMEALEQIRLRLNYWLSTRVGQSISRPSSFRTDAKLLVFALRNLSSEAGGCSHLSSERLCCCTQTSVSIESQYLLPR